jgi:hypothetical protein
MKKQCLLPIFLALVVGAFAADGRSEYAADVIDKLKIESTEIPEGFMYGRIPGFAQRVLKDNPWRMDRDAIKHLAGRIYPGGNSAVMNAIHMTIIANADNPFGDDIVCYIILYNDSRSAKAEIAKVVEYVGYNSDRSIALVRDNMVVYYCVDDVDHFHYIREMAERTRSRLESL